MGSGVSKRRLTIFYVVLFAAGAIIAAVSFSAGSSEEPATPIAGGYVLAEDSECLGAGFDLKQSGKFVSITNPDQTVSGALSFDDTTLTGDVKCTGGSTAAIDAEVSGRSIEGTLGEEEIAAEFDSEPPPGGTQQPRAPSSIAGEYKVSPRSECLSGAIEIEEHGEAFELLVEGEARGELTYTDGTIEGSAECGEGGEAEVTGQAADRTLELTIAEGGDETTVTATKQREFGGLLAQFFVAVVVVMLVARLFGALAVRIAQPRVMGEVIAGICLGPDRCSARSRPSSRRLIFPSDVIPLIGVVANLGLIFYMFLVGLELDATQLKGRVSQAFAISNMSVVFPLALGLAAAVPIYALVGPDTKFVAFALYIGVAMSITAFPVLARILVERRMLKKPVGALTMAAAAIDDVTAWFLIALASAVAVAGSSLEVVRDVVLALVFCADHVRRRAGRSSPAPPTPTTRPAGFPSAGSRRSSPAS